MTITVDSEQQTLTARHKHLSPRVSIVIPTLDRGAALLETITSALNTSFPLELIVIDQSDSDLVARLLAERGLLQDARLVYRRSAVKSGCRARNEGARLARADIVGFIDHDCILGPTWAETVVRRFEAHPEIALTYHALVAPPGDIERAGGWTPVFQPSLEGRISLSWRAIDQLGFGGNCALRKAALQRLGFFDECLGPGSVFGAGEDTDLGYRALLAGLGVFVFQEPSVVHLGRRDGPAASIQGTRYVMSMAGYCVKHARCGDLAMLLPVVHGEALFLARGARLLAHGRRPSGWRAAHGILVGIVAGFRLGVDRRTRLYRARS